VGNGKKQIPFGDDNKKGNCNDKRRNAGPSRWRQKRASGRDNDFGAA
jgi:hypothetical protein